MGLKHDMKITDQHLAEMVTLFERASEHQDYYTTFLTLLDYGIAEHSACPAFTYPTNYTDSQKALFPKMLQCAIRYVRSRANLWTGDRHASGWADPFGTLFETIAGNFKKSAQGLFFTPTEICTMSAQLIIGDDQTPGKTLAEPACGSGRMVLAAAALNPGLYCCANDIDHACTKMTALNMCLNGVVGEVTCMDGIWPYEDQYRFGYQVVPLLWLIEMLPPGAENLIQVIAYMQGFSDYRKTYALLPLDFKDCKMGLDPKRETTAQAAQNSSAARESAGTPTLEALFKEVLPIGTQGRLFE
jgi:hypothetical protein